jgi:hypothetical protein
MKQWLPAGQGSHQEPKVIRKDGGREKNLKRKNRQKKGKK